MNFRAVSAVVIAVALVAGCTGPSPSQPAATAPAPADSSPQATVQRRDFQLSYRLEGATARSAEVPITPPAGLQWAQTLRDGSTVRVGTVVGRWAVDPEYEQALAESAKTSRVDAARLATLGQRAGEVVSPVSGSLMVTPGGVSVRTAGIDVVVPLTGIQELRLSSLAIEGQATVETVAGQRTVRCQVIWTVPAHSSAIDSAAGTSAELHCRLPQVVETAAGLRAGLHVTSQTIPDAIVVPDAMLGYDDSGYTVTLRVDGIDTTVPVDVGPSDGVVRVVTTDLPVGAVLVPPPTTR